MYAHQSRPWPYDFCRMGMQGMGESGVGAPCKTYPDEEQKQEMLDLERG